MANRAIPDALAMRHLRTAAATDAERDRTTQALCAAGRDTQALLLYEGRVDHPSLKARSADAAAQGRVFHLLTLRRLGVPVTDDQLRACAQVAGQAGHALEARLAYVAIGDPEAVRALGVQLPPSLRPPEPPPPPPETSTS